MSLMSLLKEVRDGSGPRATVPTPANAPLEPQGVGLAVVTAEPDALVGFLQTVLPGTGAYCVFRAKSPRHFWFDTIDELAQGIRQQGNATDVYFGTASFIEKTSRSQANASELKNFRLDLDAGATKLAKHGADKVYLDQDAALVDLIRFSRETKLMPSIIVSSGDGLHVYYVLDAPMLAPHWTPTAQEFKRLCAAHGLKADPAVTADSARILRPIGTKHPNGKTVEIIKSTGKAYSVDEFAGLVGASTDAPDVALVAGASRVWDDSINSDIPEVQSTPKSITKILAACGAANHAALNQATIEEPYWRAMIGLAKHTVEGRDAAHKLSEQHPKYSAKQTDDYYDRWATGPTTCARFEEFNPKACGGCEHRGKITSPIQLGAEIGAPTPQHISEMNQRYATCRMGSKVPIVDMATPSIDGGVGVGFLDEHAFRLLLAGQFAPGAGAGGRPRPLAVEWLGHRKRRHFDGIGFFPPPARVPANFLNLWQGFTVAPVAGDVGPWLRVLEAVAPNPAERDYVLKWFAWKVQNPGGVPDTLLILTGKKGTGKNSLLNLIVALFGRHGKIIADPELIAGRFTYHLMDAALVVMDEPVFVNDRQQADRLKTRITGKSVMFEQKGMDPVSGENHAAYVLLTNHAHSWQASMDERRAVVIETPDTLAGKDEASKANWKRYHDWADGVNGTDVRPALLHYLLTVDVSAFNPRNIPRGASLNKQIELTALGDPVVAWWHTCLSEGRIATANLSEDEDTALPAVTLRMSYEDSAGGRGRYAQAWAAVAKRISEWTGGLRKERGRSGAARESRYVLPPLSQLRDTFTAKTGVRLD